MIRFAVVRVANGEVVRTGGCGADDLLSQADGVDFIAIEAPPEIRGDTHWYDGDSFVAYSQAGAATKRQQPGSGWTWSPAAESWIDNRTLKAAKDDAWLAIKARRDVAFGERAVSSVGIAYSITKDKENLGDRIKSLEAAISIGAASSASTATWRDLDNNAHPLSIADYYLLAAEMGARGQAIFEASWALDALVRSAADKAAIAAINLEAGWP
ncbi:MAG: DUF4376 domain-containing protein [Burkholderiales bacterium]|nr:DUF4376 domain-containing protein [Burkholderiales bacterium]